MPITKLKIRTPTPSKNLPIFRNHSNMIFAQRNWNNRNSTHLINKLRLLLKLSYISQSPEHSIPPCINLSLSRYSCWVRTWPCSNSHQLLLKWIRIIHFSGIPNLWSDLIINPQLPHIIFTPNKQLMSIP